MDKPEPATRLPLVAAFALVAVLLLSIPLTGFARLDATWLIYLLGTLAIAAGHLAFTHFIYREGKKGLWLAWKKFTGYSIPVFYFVHALPRVTWQKLGLIGGAHANLIFGATLLATLLGILVFWFASRPATLAAVGVIQADEVKDRALRKRRMRERQVQAHRRNILLAGLEWVDALAWAAIAVLLVNIFVFQLYVVPSESMVPAFLVGDRPFTLKLETGPRIPLTEWRLPFLRLPQRGDVVTIANPRYPENHGVDLKKYLSQLVYMITFTTVNLDATLPDGTPKADPLVKRVTGVPGDRLMMVDDQLYVRRAGDADWRVVKEPWAHVDLWKEPDAFKKKIQVIPIDEQTRAFLTSMDEERKAVDTSALSKAIAVDLAAAEASFSRIGPGLLASFEAKQLTRAPSSAVATRDEAIALAAKGGNPWAAAGSSVDDFSLALAAAKDRASREAFLAYAKGAIQDASIPPDDAYERAARALSLEIKANVIARTARDLSLVASSAPIDAFGSDVALTRLQTEARKLDWYLRSAWDSRNFPAFPSKTGYLGPTQYFAMGDNRYNSLDFRYREGTLKARALDPADPVPVTYPSMLDPFPLEREFIEGTALFRLWPFTRFGQIK
ncbi:MAG TPA: signal peptidase I [Rectinemataceae bacterium]|nr:signal peptidase I [Rectinemataceae bacterium]